MSSVHKDRDIMWIIKVCLDYGAPVGLKTASININIRTTNQKT